MASVCSWDRLDKLVWKISKCTCSDEPVQSVWTWTEPYQRLIKCSSFIRGGGGFPLGRLLSEGLMLNTVHIVVLRWRQTDGDGDVSCDLPTPATAVSQNGQGVLVGGGQQLWTWSALASVSILCFILIWGWDSSVGPEAERVQSPAYVRAELLRRRWTSNCTEKRLYLYTSHFLCLPVLLWQLRTCCWSPPGPCRSTPVSLCTTQHKL